MLPLCLTTFIVLAFHLASCQQKCNPKSLITSHEGVRKCMYTDTRGIKTIGIGFNLNAAGAKAAVTAAGANYDKIVNGASTPPNKACDCSSVTCLTDIQIDKLFNVSLNTAQKAGSQALSSYFSLCCPVQNAVTDMAFNLGGSAFQNLQIFIGFLNQNNWAAAADDMMLAKYCQDADTRGRCLEDIGYIRQGCPCFGQYGMQCPANQACCTQNSLCCPYTYEFNGYVKKNLTEIWCCPLKTGVCCAGNDQHCCTTKYPNCCGAPDPHCCPAGYPVCCPDNYCCPPNTRCGPQGRCLNDSPYGKALISAQKGRPKIGATKSKDAYKKLMYEKLHVYQIP